MLPTRKRKAMLRTRRTGIPPAFDLVRRPLAGADHVLGDQHNVGPELAHQVQRHGIDIGVFGDTSGKARLRWSNTRR
jgi:hypothetical protein